ncbi:helix-turn-helix domain-containing protein [Brevibacterium otitidis]|uniref:Helix-turn-helix domain-containing protein n=1 Tax=Brevibacterium otitidis TaxID=53364 RepID=A0ABV5X4E2_9MICO|nr:hypothetical protein GCM10023233_23050 [Brevibacterium otitidis]
MTETNKQLIAANVRAELARRSISVADLARQVGMTEMSMHRRVTGKIDFRASELMEVAETVGVDGGIFFRRSPAELAAGARPGNDGREVAS